VSPEKPKINFVSVLEGFNAGAPIPQVDPRDLSAALGLFTVLRAHAAHVGLPADGYSFMLDELVEQGAAARRRVGTGRTRRPPARAFPWGEGMCQGIVCVP
jgi:hypothetical protein